MINNQARKQPWTPRVAKSFLRGPKFFQLCPIVFNYARHISQGGEKFCRGFLPPIERLLWQPNEIF